MKKIMLASIATALAGSAGATAITSGADITSGGCALLSATVKVNLSTGNVGSYDCNTTTASIGVAVASTTGKNKVYSAGSAGGGITETTLSSAPTTSNTDTQAAAKSASS